MVSCRATITHTGVRMVRCRATSDHKSATFAHERRYCGQLSCDNCPHKCESTTTDHNCGQMSRGIQRFRHSTFRRWLMRCTPMESVRFRVYLSQHYTHEEMLIERVRISRLRENEREGGRDPIHHFDTSSNYPTIFDYPPFFSRFIFFYTSRTSL